MPIEKMSHIIYGPQVNTPTCQSIYQQKPGKNLFLKKNSISAGDEVRKNKAVNALLNVVMAGTYINTNISYPTIIRSNGSIPEAENAHVSSNNNGGIIFTWTDNSGTGNANTNDKVILIAYFPILKKMIYLLHAATRGTGKALLTMNTMRGNVADTWIGFVSHDESEAGKGLYAGRVIF